MPSPRLIGKRIRHQSLTKQPGTRNRKKEDETERARTAGEDPAITAGISLHRGPPWHGFWGDSFRESGGSKPFARHGGPLVGWQAGEDGGWTVASMFTPRAGRIEISPTVVVRPSSRRPRRCRSVGTCTGYRRPCRAASRGWNGARLAGFGNEHSGAGTVQHSRGNLR
jgi:hypothetical protein